MTETERRIGLGMGVEGHKPVCHGYSNFGHVYTGGFKMESIEVNIEGRFNCRKFGLGWIRLGSSCHNSL